ncbi:MAG TPA: urease accessory UreF family protein [Jatrophihabitantaceae bacterium]|jgi:urease accessory protein
MNALLLLLLDSRSPAGAHSHSGGMEAAVTAGFVRDDDDVRAFCRGRLRTSGRVAAAFAAAACQAWPSGDWRALHAELDARMPSEAMRAGSYAMGAGLRRLLRSMGADLAELGDPVHHPVVLGAGVAFAGGTARDAARAAALATCTGPASAAIRLLGLDPYAVHGLLAELAPEIETVSSRSCNPVRSGAAESCTIAELPADSAPALDLLADVHAVQEVRLFAS